MGLNQSVVLVDAFLTTDDIDSFTFEMCSFIEKTGEDGGRRGKTEKLINQIQDWEDGDRRRGKAETIETKM